MRLAAPASEGPIPRPDRPLFQSAEPLHRVGVMRRFAHLFFFTVAAAGVALTACMAPSIPAEPEPTEHDAGEPEDPPHTTANEPQCTEYCDTVMDACKGGFAASGSNQQFPTRVAC